MAYAKIRPRRGTLREWSTINPILAEGELALELPEESSTGLCKFKIGDGYKQYNSLPYAFDGSAASAIYGGSVDTYNEIYIRSGSTNEWNSSNPIIGLGEIVYDITSKKIKIGDGVTRWKALPYYKDEAVAPESHSSAFKTYGVGTPSLYGHVKISDNYKNTPEIADKSGMALSLNGAYNLYLDLNERISDNSTNITQIEQNIEDIIEDMGKEKKSYEIKECTIKTTDYIEDVTKEYVPDGYKYYIDINVDGLSSNDIVNVMFKKLFIPMAEYCQFAPINESGSNTLRLYSREKVATYIDMVIIIM